MSNNIRQRTYIDYGAYFECVLQKDHHIRDEIFEVTIPALFPLMDNQYEGGENVINSGGRQEQFERGQSVGDMTWETTIYAKNHTDYAFQFKGDVFKDRYSEVDGITEDSEDPSPDGAPDDIIDHDHDIKKAMSILNFYFENLNNVKVPKGSLAYGFFINGTYDVNNFVIVRIEGAVPLKKDDVIRYVK